MIARHKYEATVTREEKQQLRLSANLSTLSYGL